VRSTSLDFNRPASISARRQRFDAYPRTLQKIPTLLGLALVGLLLLFLHNAPRPQTAPPAIKLLRYSFTLHNPSNTPISEAGIRLFAPVAVNATQTCRRITVDQPHEILPDAAGNRVIHLPVKTLAPFGSRVVNVEAEIALYAAPRRVRLPDRDPWLKSARFIESDHPELRQLAAGLRGRGTLQTAERIFSWVSSNLRSSGVSAKDRGALHAFKTRAGDCTEFAGLFAALCRAAGIPARVVGGFVLRESGIVSFHDYHNWAEFHHDGTWHLADPQRGVFRGGTGDYIAMQINAEDGPLPAGERFKVLGTGLRVRMN
jgi:transglutaminase-like putative cysteine protease